ncbi:MAG: S-layer homology domain-containing protein [Firmicutes bacterium]|nr:S-layer homology domain-containing protein [Bacillota bacterium]
MKSNKILSLLLICVLIFSTLSFPANADADENLYETAIHNIAAKCAQEDITKDVNFIWFLADMMAYKRLYPESENILSAEEIEKCKEELLDFAENAKDGRDLAKSIIGFRALGYDAQNIYKSDTEKLEIVEKLSALIDSKSQSVTNIYTLPYVVIAMREYANETQSTYLIKAMIAQKQKEKWQDASIGLDAATPMILALAPYSDEDADVKTAILESVKLIEDMQSESGAIPRRDFETGEWIDSAASTGLAITALSAIGENPETVIKNEKNLIDGIMSFKTPENNGFLTSSFDTEQGFRGLLAYKLSDKGTSIFDFSDYPKNELRISKGESVETEKTGHASVNSTDNPQAKTENVSVTVKVMMHNADDCNNSYTYKHNSAKYTAVLSKKIEIDKNMTVYDATVKAFDENDISYIINSKSIYFETINGLSEFDHGDYSGWMYMVDGKHQNVGCDQIKVKPNSVIVWYYTDDYTNEYGSETYGYPAKKKEQKETEDKETEKDSNKENVILSDICSFIIDNVPAPQVASIGGEWAVIGLAASGTDVPKGYFDRYYENVENTVKEKKGILHSRKYTEYSRVVIALTLIGKNPEDVAGVNLVQPICDFQKTTAQGLNGAVWALIALDSGNYADDEIRQKYVDYILERQLKDGGWAIGRDEQEADCDITAMALTALSNYTKVQDISKAIERGIAFLSKIQDDNGGFSTFGETASESISQVITALSSLGIGLEEFSKNGRTPLDALLDYYKEGEGFSHTLGGEVNMMSTEQALYALSAVKHLKNGETPVFRTCKFYDISGNKSETAILTLYKKGIISGMGKNTFAPDEKLTRAQFTVLLTKALNLGTTAKSHFSDVNDDDWFFCYVNCAYEKGLVFGISESEFNPNGNITCEEAAAILSRASVFWGIDKDYSMQNAALLSDVSDWAKDSFVFCIDTGILDGVGISAKQTVMRSDIAQMIYNLLKKAERV